VIIKSIIVNIFFQNISWKTSTWCYLFFWFILIAKYFT